MKKDDVQLIEEYLAGSLTAAEKKDVEQRLQREEDLARQLARQRETIDILRAARRAELKAELRQKLKDRPKRSGPKLLVLPVVLAGAAAVALLLLVVLPLLETPVNPRQYAAQLQQAYPMDQMRNPEAGRSLPPALVTAYQSGEYTVALEYLQPMLAEQPDNERLLFFTANSLAQVGRHAEAAELFSRIPASSPFAEAARWYRALSLVLDERPAEALPLLESIRQGPHYRQAQADSLWQAIR